MFSIFAASRHPGRGPGIQKDKRGNSLFRHTLQNTPGEARGSFICCENPQLGQWGNKGYIGARCCFRGDMFSADMEEKYEGAM